MDKLKQLKAYLDSPSTMTKFEYAMTHVIIFIVATMAYNGGQ